MISCPSAAARAAACASRADGSRCWAAGMVDPALFGFVGLRSGEGQGFAFGMGVERLAMMKYNVDDIQQFFEGDMRFLASSRED